MKFRHEYKHQMNFGDVFLLRKRLEVFLKRDSHSDSEGTYKVNSLYFDNYRDKALREKQDGVDKREKFRIRYYGTDTSFIRLEKKTKIHGLCNKQSVMITAEECEKIIKGDTAFMLEGDRELLKELYAKMKYQLLKPKCIVTYTRESFVHEAGNVRITIDSNISGSYNVAEFLNPDVPVTKLYQNAILEVKWDENLPQVICNLVQIKGRKASAFSKYAAVRIW